MKSLHTYQVAPYESGVGGLKLVKDGNECFCPKLMPMLFTKKSALGQVEQFPVRIPCNTQCAHANVYEDENKSLTYVTTCEGIRIETPCEDMPVSEENPETEKKSNVISLK